MPVKDEYPIKKATDMSDEEFANWWAFVESLKIIFGHAERYNLDIDEVNLDTRKIIKEYISPMSGDILYQMQKEKKEAV